MAWALKILLFVGCCYAAVCLVLFLYQSRLIFIPSADQAGTPDRIGLGFEEVWLVSRGKRVHAWFVPAVAPARGAVLFCHGNAGNISHRLDTLRILHSLGLDMLIFDYQGYGLSEGKPSETAAYADAHAAWDWLMDRGADPGRVVVMGRSLGGAVAAGLVDDLGREGVAPAGLVLESAFTSVPDMGAQQFPYLPIRLLSRFSFDILDRTKRLDCPVLVVHSPEDDIVPYSHGLALIEALKAAGKDVAFLELAGDHNTGFLVHEARYVPGLEAFFNRVLEGPEP